MSSLVDDHKLTVRPLPGQYAMQCHAARSDRADLEQTRWDSRQPFGIPQKGAILEPLHVVPVVRDQPRKRHPKSSPAPLSRAQRDSGHATAGSTPRRDRHLSRRSQATDGLSVSPLAGRVDTTPLSLQRRSRATRQAAATAGALTTGLAFACPSSTSGSSIRCSRRWALPRRPPDAGPSPREPRRGGTRGRCQAAGRVRAGGLRLPQLHAGRRPVAPGAWRAMSRRSSGSGPSRRGRPSACSTRHDSCSSPDTPRQEIAQAEGKGTEGRGDVEPRCRRHRGSELGQGGARDEKGGMVRGCTAQTR